MQDAQDLREFIETGSQGAFVGLVGRHVDLVYSAAMRQVRNHHLAQDVTQNVFLDLARKARGLRRETVLGAWLLVATRYAARDALRSAARRRGHEREAAMTRNETTADEAPEAAWKQMAGSLDDALAELPEADRRLIVVRYLEQRTVEEAAGLFGISAAAVRQRAHRAIERLRERLAGRGVNVSGGTLAAVLAANAIGPAPAGLATTVVGALSLQGLAGGGLAMKGAVILMTIKSNVAVIGVVLLLLLGGATVMYLQPGRPGTNSAATSPAPPAATQTEHAATTPVTAPVLADWRARFNQTYGLAEGETVKRVRPPYIAERRSFMQTMPMVGGVSPDEHQMTLEWDGRQANWISMSGAQGSLASFLQMGVRLRPYELEEWGGKYALPMKGDWIVRKGASVEEKLRGLERVLLDELGRKVRFEQRRVPREAIVVRGTYAYQSLDDSAVVSGADVIDVVGKRPMPGRETMIAEGTIADFCRHLETVLVRRVIDETTRGGGGAGAGKDETRLKWRDHHPGSGEAGDVLIKLEWQTSLKLAREMRQMEVWFMVDVNP